MDAMEKILNSLIDSMHAKMAAGKGKSKVDPKEEMEKASEEKAEPAKEQSTETEAPKSMFESWMASQKAKPTSTKAGIMITQKAVPSKKSKK